MKKNLPILIALAALLVLGVTRYEHFASAYNITSFWRYNSMFALISVGMAFVIITGGIDLSVGAVAALGSVVAALASPHGGVAAVLAGSCAGLAVGVLNGLVITHMRILPFIVTLATSLGAHGLALLLGHNDAVAISAESNFAQLRPGRPVRPADSGTRRGGGGRARLDRVAQHPLRTARARDRRQRRSVAADGAERRPHARLRSMR